MNTLAPAERTEAPSTRSTGFGHHIVHYEEPRKVFWMDVTITLARQTSLHSTHGQVSQRRSASDSARTSEGIPAIGLPLCGQSLLLGLLRGRSV